MSIKVTIKNMRDLAKKHNGKCLSKEYINGYTELLWECENNHIFSKTPQNIHSCFCAQCAKENERRAYLEKAKKIATSRGGKCLSIEYIDNASHLTWECFFGHIWESSLNCIKNGTWCPTCSTGIEERIVRQFFEQIFNEKFIKIRPKWLRSDSGFCMELDGYCEKLNIAWEYNGEQHYSEKTKTKYKSLSLEKRIKYDKMKIELCKINKTKLIIIPQLNLRVHIDNLKSFIKEQLIINGIPIPENYDNIEIDINKAYACRESIYMEEILRIIKEKGGTFISGTYLTNNSKFKFICKNGHTRIMTGMSLRAGHWCKNCFKRETLSLKEMYELAKNRNCKCLSTEYINMNSKLEWKCLKCDYEWYSFPSNMYNGNGCPVCNKGYHKQFDITYIREYLKNMGYTLLSKEYNNHREKLEISCDNCGLIIYKPFRNFKSGKRRCICIRKQP